MHRLQTELKYSSKNRCRFTQRYYILHDENYIFLTGNMCPLQFCRWSEAQVYYTKKKCFLRNIFTLAHKTLCCWHMCLCNKHNYHQSYILACSSILWRTILTKIVNAAFSNWRCYAYSTLHFIILTLLGSNQYYIMILVDKVLIHSIDLPKAEKVMYSNLCIVYSLYRIVSLSVFAEPTLNLNL